MKTRILYTKIWEDDWFSTLPSKAKLLFLYCLTNSKINLCGVYELSERIICFDLGLTQKGLDKLKPLLKGKVNFAKGWVCVVNADKYYQYTGSKNETAKEKELSMVPADTLSNIKNTVSVFSDTPINHKSEIINNKSKTINHKSEIPPVPNFVKQKIKDLHLSTTPNLSHSGSQSSRLGQQKAGSPASEVK